jgi:hypothetical protein
MHIRNGAWVFNTKQAVACRRTPRKPHIGAGRPQSRVMKKQKKIFDL